MSFIQTQSGAVTVDWVVLTAGLVGLGLATMAVVSTGVQDVSEDTRVQLESSDIITAAFPPTYDWSSYVPFGSATTYNNRVATMSNRSNSVVMSGYTSRFQNLFNYDMPYNSPSANPNGTGARVDDLVAYAAELDARGIERPDYNGHSVEDWLEQAGVESW